MARNAETGIATLTMDDVVCDSRRYKAELLKATAALARSKPWRGAFAERFKALRTWLAAAVAAHGLEPITLTHKGSRSGCSGASRLTPDGRTIILSGRLSVVTVMHLFRKAAQLQAGGELPDGSDFEAICWSATLFRRKFPLSFSRCRLVNGLLVNQGRRDD